MFWEKLVFLKIAAKLTAFEAIDSLDVVKCFPEIHGDQQMNVMLNKLIGKLETLNPLSANPTKWPNTLKQFVGNLPTNCLSVFGHFVGLALKGSSYKTIRKVLATCFVRNKVIS